MNMMFVEGLTMENTETVNADLLNTSRDLNKIAKFLFDLARNNVSAGHITITKIAQMLDITPYDVNESLRLLQDIDYVQLKRGRIIIRKMGRYTI